VYALASIHVHGTLTAAEEHLHIGQDDEILLDFGPSTNQVELVLSEVSPYLLSLAGEWAKILNAPTNIWSRYEALRELYIQEIGKRIGQQEATVTATRVLDQRPWIPHKPEFSAGTTPMVDDTLAGGGSGDRGG
jgi:hypothetical protein